MATDGLVVEYSHTVTWTESDPEYFTPDILYEPAKDFKNIHPITWIDSEYESDRDLDHVDTSETSNIVK